MGMNTNYWVSRGSTVTGPYDQLQIRGLVAIGQLTALMDLSNDGKHWLPAGSVKGLFAAKSTGIQGAEGKLVNDAGNGNNLSDAI